MKLLDSILNIKQVVQRIYNDDGKENVLVESKTRGGKGECKKNVCRYPAKR